MVDLSPTFPTIFVGKKVKDEAFPPAYINLLAEVAQEAPNGVPSPKRRVA